MLKGFDEDCYGYGHEDDILDEKIRKYNLKVHNINDISIHIYHETSEDNKGIYYSFQGINKQLFAEYKEMSQTDIKNKIENIKIWGDPDSYSSDDLSYRHIKRELFESTANKVLDYTLSKFTDDYIGEIVNDISVKIYNDIVDTVSEKVKKELDNIRYSDDEKQNMVKQIMRKFKL